MRSRNVRTLLVIAGALGGLAAVLSGCVPLAAGAGATGATVATQERGVKGAISDNAIRARINGLWFDHDEKMYRKVTLSVSEGRVMLTGRVDSAQMMADAVRLAWKANGVKEVINEIQVNDEDGVGAFFKDAWILTQLKTKLAFDDRVSSRNYSIDAVSGVVYLLGIAKDEDELQRVTNHAKNLGYVRKVVSHVRLRTDPRRKADSS